MNLTQIKCLSVFAIFAIIGFGPISLGCLIGLYVVLFRPVWFWTLITGLYEKKSLLPATNDIRTAIQTKQTRKKCFLSLLGLFIIDIAPVPVTPVIAFVIILSRPLWFYQLAARIYEKSENKRQEQHYQEKIDPTAASQYSPENRSYEQILGLSAGWEADDLKNAYKRESQRTHPDKWIGKPEHIRQVIEVEYKAIQEAYRKLKK